MYRRLRLMLDVSAMILLGRRFIRRILLPVILPDTLEP
jgi:hypothetical protein